jgi:hypothetical protein
LKLIIAGAIVFGLLAALVLGYLLPHIEGLKSIAMIMSSLYNMLVLCLLMGFGLFNLPIFLWKFHDHRESLYAELQRADQVRRDYRESMAEFYVVVNKCKNLIANHKTSKNAEFMDVLASEMPEKDLEGQTIGQSKNFQLDIKKGAEVSEDFIAEIRNQFKAGYFLYRRKKSRWIALNKAVLSLTEQPVQFEEGYLKK